MAYVGNLAEFLMHALGFAPGSHLYNYVDKPDLDMNGLVALANQTPGRGRPVRIPYALGMAAGAVGDWLARLIGHLFAISSVRVRKYAANTRFAAQRIGSTGFTPAISCATPSWRRSATSSPTDSCRACHARTRFWLAGWIDERGGGQRPCCASVARALCLPKQRGVGTSRREIPPGPRSPPVRSDNPPARTPMIRGTAVLAAASAGWRHSRLALPVTTADGVAPGISTRQARGRRRRPLRTGSGRRAPGHASGRDGLPRPGLARTADRGAISAPAWRTAGRRRSTGRSGRARS
jgi:hypothetical protein